MSPTEKALLLDEVLATHYGAPFIPHGYRDPVSELVKSMLSHRTKNAVSRQGYDRLRELYPTWQEVIDGDTGRIEEAIKMVTFPEVKAPRIQQALREIQDRNGGELDLDGLAEVPVPEARAWLEAIPGVGAKTSAAVLSFSYLRLPALVVDTHHLRVTQRLGLVPPKATLDRAAKILQAYLPADWDGQRVYDSHQGFMRHGQKVCHWRKPACALCLVREHCDHYQAEVAARTKPTPATSSPES